MNANHTHSMPLEIAQMYDTIAIILTLFYLFYFSNLGI